MLSLNSGYRRAGYSSMLLELLRSLASHAQGGIVYKLRAVPLLCSSNTAHKFFVSPTSLSILMWLGQGRPLPFSFPECGFGDAPPICERA